jgi:hypothetical protein
VTAGNSVSIAFSKSTARHRHAEGCVLRHGDPDADHVLLQDLEYKRAAVGDMWNEINRFMR